MCRICQDCHQGLIVAQDDRGWFHVKEDGTPAYKHRYLRTEYFASNGTAWVQKQDGTWAKIDPAGNELEMIDTSRFV